MNPETVRKWLWQAEVDAGYVDGTTTAAAREIRELKRKNAELAQTVEILKPATSFFVRASDPAAGDGAFIAEHRGRSDLPGAV